MIIGALVAQRPDLTLPLTNIVHDNDVRAFIWFRSANEHAMVECPINRSVNCFDVRLSDSQHIYHNLSERYSHPRRTDLSAGLSGVVMKVERTAERSDCATSPIHSLLLHVYNIYLKYAWFRKHENNRSAGSATLRSTSLSS